MVIWDLICIDNCEKMEEMGIDKCERKLHMWNLSATMMPAYNTEVQAKKDAQAAKEAAAVVGEVKKVKKPKKKKRKKAKPDDEVTVDSDIAPYIAGPAPQSPTKGVH